MIREVLRNSGLDFQLHVSRDGQDALSYLQGGSGAALVLLDLNIPKVAGVEVLRQLRADARYSRTCVVVVSSSDSEFDRKAVERLGVQAYFQKPADLRAYRELAVVIKKALGFK